MTALANRRVRRVEIPARWVTPAMSGLPEAVERAPREPWRLREPGDQENSSFPSAWAASLLAPERSPLGANDWAGSRPCAHGTPVVLIHGTWENAYAAWNGLAPILVAQGYRVFAPNYGRTGVPGVNGTGDLVTSANELWDFVQRVLEATRAPQVSLVGHSQGGAQARYVANLLAPPGVVEVVIGVAPTNRPVTVHGLVRLADVVGARRTTAHVIDALHMPAVEQLTDPASGFFTALDRVDETRRGTRYVQIMTRYDQLVSADQSCLATDPGTQATNVTIQDLCPQDLSDHVSLAYSRNVAQVVLNHLDPADARPLACRRQWPVIGRTD